jgi:ABC-type nitrate/sulfonate/bicarbonate transport system substrate-binding protein
MKKTLIASLFTAVLVGIAVTCPAAEGREKMKLVYSAYDFTLDVVIALEKGYFDQLGLDLDPVNIDGGTSAIISTLHRGEIDGCFIASPGALMSIEKGIPLVQVSGIGNQDFTYYAHKDSAVNSLADFEGKIVGNVPKPSGPWLALKYDLDNQKIKPRLLEMRTENIRISSLMARQADVVSGAPYWESVFGDEIRLVHSCTMSKYIWNSCGWWFKPEFIKEHPKAIKRFVEGLAMARTFIDKNYDESIEILAKARFIDLAKMKTPIKLPQFDNPPVIYKYGLEKTAEIMVNYGLLQTMPKIDDYVDGRFAKAIETDY